MFATSNWSHANGFESKNIGKLITDLFRSPLRVVRHNQDCSFMQGTVSKYDLNLGLQLVTKTTNSLCRVVHN